MAESHKGDTLMFARIFRILAVLMLVVGIHGTMVAQTAVELAQEQTSPPTQQALIFTGTTSNGVTAKIIRESNSTTLLASSLIDRAGHSYRWDTTSGCSVQWSYFGARVILASTQVQYCTYRLTKFTESTGDIAAVSEVTVTPDYQALPSAPNPSQLGTMRLEQNGNDIIVRHDDPYNYVVFSVETDEGIGWTETREIDPARFTTFTMPGGINSVQVWAQTYWLENTGIPGDGNAKFIDRTQATFALSVAPPTKYTLHLPVVLNSPTVIWCDYWWCYPRQN